MKLYINEKLFSIHNKFYVKDELEKDLYEISAKIISIGTKVKIFDMKEKELVYIEQDLLHLTSNYNVYIKNELICNISKKIQLFKNDYILDNDFRVEGDFLMLNFSIFNKDKKIGSIKRKFISIGDKYELEIKNKKDILIVLSIIVAIAYDIERKQRINTSDF